MAKPARRTHAERRAATRRALLDAAAELFATRGFHATSLDEIAARATLTRGALHYNFASKADLLLTLMEERIAARGEQLAQVTPDEPMPALRFDRQASLLFLEYAAVAARDPVLGAELQARLTAARAASVEHVREFLTRAGADPDLAVELVSIIGAFANGLSIEALAGEDVAKLERRFEAFIALLLRGARP